MFKILGMKSLHLPRNKFVLELSKGAGSKGNIFLFNQLLPGTHLRCLSLFVTNKFQTHPPKAGRVGKRPMGGIQHCNWEEHMYVFCYEGQITFSFLTYSQTIAFGVQVSIFEKWLHAERGCYIAFRSSHTASLGHPFLFLVFPHFLPLIVCLLLFFICLFSSN